MKPWYADLTRDWGVRAGRDHNAGAPGCLLLLVSLEAERRAKRRAFSRSVVR